MGENSLVMLSRWRYRTADHSRDLRLDSLRGYMVVVMFINHLAIWPAWTRVLTGGGRLWVSAAEGFVLVSGIVLGMLYRRRVRERGWHWSVAKISRRAWQLFLLGVGGQIVLASIDFLLRLFFERPAGVPVNYLVLLQNCVFQRSYLRVGVELLPLYAVLLPVGLLVIYLLERGKWHWALTGALFFWIGRQLDTSWFVLFHAEFQPATWQFLFVLGVMAGYYNVELGRWYEQLVLPRWLRSGVLLASALLLLVISYRISFHGLWSDIDWWGKGFWAWFFFKGILGPGRVILSCWVFAAFYEMLTWGWSLFERALGWLIIPLGQQSLVAYLVQAVLVYIVSRIPGYPYPEHSAVLVGFLQLAGVLLIWYVTGLITRLQATAARRRRFRAAALAR